MSVTTRLARLELNVPHVCGVADVLTPKQVEAQARKARDFETLMDEIAVEMAVVDAEIAAIRAANTGGRTR